MEKKIRVWDDKRRWYSRGLPLLVGLLAVLWPGLTYIGMGPKWPFFVGLAVTCGLALYNRIAYSSNGIECPACGRRLTHIAEVLLLKNLRQCPWCETSFRGPEPDA